MPTIKDALTAIDQARTAAATAAERPGDQQAQRAADKAVKNALAVGNAACPR